MSSSFKGYLPATTFVMAKRGQMKTSASNEVAALEVASVASPVVAAVITHAAPIELIFVELNSSLSGASDSLLSKMIDAMTIERARVWITHHAEFLKSLPDLSGKVVVALGEDAAQEILQIKESLLHLRKKLHALPYGNRMIATYHPRYLIENPQVKKDAWEDLKLAMRELGLNAP